MAFPPTGPTWGAPPPPPPMPPPGVPVAYPMTYAPQPFRSLRGLATAMYVLLPIAGLLSLASIPVAFNARSVVRDNTSGGFVFANRAVTDATAAMAGIAGFSLLVGLAIAVLFIIWMWRAASNLSLFGRVRPKFSPGFAIGGWFIPLANFIIPGMQMFDIDKGSGPRLRDGERARGSALVVWWWIIFIVGRMLGVFAPQVTQGSLYNASTFNVQNLLFIVGSALSAVAAVAAILVIRQITTAQDQGLADLTGAVATPPPPPVPPSAPVAAPIPPASPPPVAGGVQWPQPPGPSVGSDPE